MLSHDEGWKRSIQPGLRLLLGLALAALAVAPASAQIDPGMRRWALTTGHWSRDSRDTVAWVDLDAWKLVAQANETLVADPDPSPWMPVAGDWNGSGVKTVKMFDARSWKLVALSEGPIVFNGDPDPNPWVPVAGNWDGSRIDTVRVVDLRDRSVHKIEEGPPRDTGSDDPSPNPWRPVIGDWYGKGVSSLGWVQGTGALGVWTPVAGDWTGSGVTTLAAVHNATGDLVLPARARRAEVSEGCYLTVKNRTEFALEIVGPDGSPSTSHLEFHEEWTCCPLGSGAPLYSCNENLASE